MIDLSVFELGDIVLEILEKNRCTCGSTLQIFHVETNGHSWLVYAKCPNGCFEDDEYDLFKINRIG